MVRAVDIVIQGITSFDDIEDLDPKITDILRQATNETTQEARRRAARSMEKQINFPRGYLTGQAGRLGIAKYATKADLTAIVRGRDRPTSLARFVQGSPQVGKKGVSVTVDPGKSEFMPNAFLIKLRNSNIGLAYRTKDGKAPSRGAKKLGKGLWLLYAPSVDQVFDETREELRPELETLLREKFERLLEAKT
jgi:hypothetical protein